MEDVFKVVLDPRTATAQAAVGGGSHAGKKRMILLVGPSQVGKSTLGSILVAGEPYNQQETPFFVAGHGAQRMTAALQTAALRHELSDHEALSQKQKGKKAGKSKKKASGAVDFVVADTPGANSTNPVVVEEKELLVMQQQLRDLASQDCSLALVVFVVSFVRGLTPEHRTTVQYYARMLPTVTSANFLLLITHTQPGDEDWYVRQADAVPALQKIIAWHQQLLELDSAPPTLLFDGTAFQGPKWEYTAAARACVLARAAAAPLLSLREAIFPPKTARRVKDDRAKAKQCEHEATVALAEAARLEKEAKVATARCEKSAKLAKQHGDDASEKEERIAELDKGDLEPVGDPKRVHDRWHYMWRPSARYEFTPNEQKCKFAGVRASNGTVVEEAADEHLRTGKVRGKWWTILDAEVWALAERRDVHREELLELKEEVKAVRQREERAKQALAKPEREAKAKSAAAKAKRAEAKKLEKRSERLRQLWMSLDDDGDGDGDDDDDDADDKDVEKVQPAGRAKSKGRSKGKGKGKKKAK